MKKQIANPMIKAITKHGGDFVRYLSKNSPVILTGCAVAGAFAAVGFAIKASKPAMKHIKEAKIEHRDRIIITDGDKREDFELTEEEIEQIELKPLEIVQACWKDYVPTAIALGGTAACIIGAHSISAKRTAAMAALYTMSEQALKDYKLKAEEIVGKGKATQIKDAVLGEQTERYPYDPENPINLGPGEVLCQDYTTGRYFASNMDRLGKIVAELNMQLAYGDNVSLNDFYYAIGLSGVEYGNDAGWSVDNMIELAQPTSKVVGGGIPVLVIAHKNRPTAWYYD